MIRTLLREATAERTGLRLGSSISTGPSLALDPDALEHLLPDHLRGYFGPPIASTGADVRRLPIAASRVVGCSTGRACATT